MAAVSERGLPVVVALGTVDPALVTGVLDGHCRFVAAPGEADLAAAAGAIVRADARVDQALLARAPRLRVLARTGVGTDLVDVPAATARGIAVVITPGAGAAAVAEGAIGMALHLVKRFGPLTALVREGRWAQRDAAGVGDLDGATLGVVGYGRIGRRAAALGAAFGMRVLAYDPVSEPPAGLCCPDLGDLAARSDVITWHLPLNGQTRRAARPAPAVPPPGRRAHPAPDGAEPARHRGDLHRRRPGCPRRAVRPRAAGRGRSCLAYLPHEGDHL